MPWWNVVVVAMAEGAAAGEEREEKGGALPRGGNSNQHFSDGGPHTPEGLASVPGPGLPGRDLELRLSVGGDLCSLVGPAAMGTGMAAIVCAVTGNPHIS